MYPKIKLQKAQEKEVTELHIIAGVRYWEDATVNGVEDETGDLIPFKDGDEWKPVIDLATGKIIDWPQGTTADIHYKVCDDGTYFLTDGEGTEIGKYDGYVPAIACPAENGYGDYIIMKVSEDGTVENFLNCLPERLESFMKMDD